MAAAALLRVTAVGPGEVEERVIRLVDRDPALIRQDAFRLFDDGSGHQCMTRSGRDLGPADLVRRQQNQRGHVRKRLTDDQLVP